MRILFSTICAMFIAGSLFAQVPLPYHVDFSTDIPSSWNQSAGSTLLWEWTSSYGKEGSGCALVDMSTQSNRATSRIETPPVVLLWAPDPILRFNVTFVRNNFMAPAISVWYNKGEGWKILDTWGESTLADFTEVNHFLEGSDDYIPPLDADRLIWHTVTADLSSLMESAEVQFAFQAEFPNGGWVLLDDVEFTTATAGVNEGSSAQGLNLVPNPTTSTLLVEAERPFTQANIVDLLGRTVLTAETAGNTLQLDVSPLPVGSYWLLLTDRNGSVCGRKSFIKR